MNLRQYLIIMSIGTAVAMSSWCVVLLSLNPLTSSTLALTAFYTTLALGLAGLFTILGTAVRAYRFPERHVGAIVNRSLRQAVFLTALFLGSLYLMALGLFSTLTLLIAILSLGFLEFFFLISSQNEVTGPDQD